MEWSKAHARARRYMEEEGLVLEEMRRVQRYFMWKSSWWRELAKEEGSELFSQGKSVYALKQASMWLSLSSSFLRSWQNELFNLKLDRNLVNI